jgi:hypothetical protein
MPHGQDVKQSNQALRSRVGVYKYLGGAVGSRLIARTLRPGFHTYSFAFRFIIW